MLYISGGLPATALSPRLRPRRSPYHHCSMPPLLDDDPRRLVLVLRRARGRRTCRRLGDVVVDADEDEIVGVHGSPWCDSESRGAQLAAPVAMVYTWPRGHPPARGRSALQRRAGANDRAGRPGREAARLQRVDGADDRRGRPRRRPRRRRGPSLRRPRARHRLRARRLRLPHAGPSGRGAAGHVRDRQRRALRRGRVRDHGGSRPRARRSGSATARSPTPRP